MSAARSLEDRMAGEPAQHDGRRQIGEAFNPWRGACGFYPPDDVSRLRNVVILSTRHRLTEGHKGLFVRLVRRCGKDSCCFPSYESLAADMGRSVRQIKTWVADLEAFGLIRHRRRGRGAGGRGLANEYTFLWHRIYEVPVSSRLRIMKCNPASFEVQDSDTLKCKNQHPLYKEETRTEESRTSSSAQHAGGAEAPKVYPKASERALSELRPAQPHEWPRGGWESAADFETWWAQVVWNHPNRNRNGAAKTKALDMIAAGTLTRSDFDEGYSAIRASAGDRWLEQDGRFAPNLWQFLDDVAWKQPRPKTPITDARQSAQEYFQRLVNE